MNLKKTLSSPRKKSTTAIFRLLTIIFWGSYIVKGMLLPTAHGAKDKNTCTEFTTADELVDYFSTTNKLLGSGAMDMANLLKEESDRKVAIADKGTTWSVTEKNQLKSMLINYPGVTYFESHQYKGSLTVYKKESKKNLAYENIPILIKEKDIDIVKESNGVFKKIEELFKLPSITEISSDKTNIKDLKKWIISSLLIGKYCNIQAENVFYFVNHALNVNYSLYKKRNKNNEHLMFFPNIRLTESNASIKPTSDHHIIEIKNFGFIFKFKDSETTSFESFYNILRNNIKAEQLDIFTNKFIEYLSITQSLFYKIDKNGMPHSNNKLGGNVHLNYLKLLNNESS